MRKALTTPGSSSSNGDWVGWSCRVDVSCSRPRPARRYSSMIALRAMRKTRFGRRSRSSSVPTFWWMRSRISATRSSARQGPRSVAARKSAAAATSRATSDPWAATPRQGCCHIGAMAAVLSAPAQAPPSADDGSPERTHEEELHPACPSSVCPGSRNELPNNGRPT